MVRDWLKGAGITLVPMVMMTAKEEALHLAFQIHSGVEKIATLSRYQVSMMLCFNTFTTVTAKKTSLQFQGDKARQSSSSAVSERWDWVLASNSSPTNMSTMRHWVPKQTVSFPPYFLYKFSKLDETEAFLWFNQPHKQTYALQVWEKERQ